MSKNPRFQIGQQFLSAGRNPRLCTVVDIHTTTNSRGEVVKVRYVAERKLGGQTVTDWDMTETGVAMGVDRLEAEQNRSDLKGKQARG